MRLPLIIIFSIISIASAKLIKYEVLGSKKEQFTYLDVCKKMGHRHLLLVERIGDSIDCMGSKVTPLEFCKAIYLTDPQYIRGYIDKSSKAIVCQKGKDVALSISCDKRDNKFCEDARASCIVLKDEFAVNLNLVHQTLLYQGAQGRVLNCHYSVQKI